MSVCEPGSPEELSRFAELQERLAPLFSRVMPDRLEPRTVVVLPSLTLDQDVIGKIAGVQHYEERLLCMLMLLRLPHTRIVYLTSIPIPPSIMDYYLQLLPGVPYGHARRRLELLSCHDATAGSTTEKILARPRLQQRIREAIGDRDCAHMTCFNATELERTLAVRLGIPLFACDPALAHLGTKSGSREILREADVEVPPGMERLRDEEDVAEALTELRRRDASLRRAVVKLEEGTSGEGNAIFDFDDCPTGDGLLAWVRRELPVRLSYEARGMSWEKYSSKLRELGAIVECWIEGPDKRSPSMQGRIDPLGRVEAISTHDQMLGGPSGQVFQGSTFPADERYRMEIQESGLRAGRVLKERSALGRYGVDYVLVPRGDTWDHYAIEINLRKGGTTHTFRTLQFLTDGAYDAETGSFHTPAGEARAYYATDNLKSPSYRRLTPVDLIDVMVEHRLHFHESTQMGVAFHLMGALSGYGKLGLTCVSDSVAGARRLYHRTAEVLDREVAGTTNESPRSGR